MVDFTQPYGMAPLAQVALAESPLLRCDLCGKSFKSSVTLASHQDSAKHKKREAEAQKLSPAKRSPVRKSLAALEQRARQLGGGAQAAQAHYDVGMQYAQQGDGADAERCLNRCLALLPPFVPAVPRVMIEVRARVVLARIGWQTPNWAAAKKQLEVALSLFHNDGKSPIFGSDEMVAVSSMFAAAADWKSACRHADLQPHLASLTREWGSRLCAQTACVAGAFLLLCGGHFDYAATVFDQLKWHGHAAECLFRMCDWRSCVHHCIIHSNPVLLRKCVDATQNGFLKQLTDAVLAWDLLALEVLCCSTSLNDADRATARQALNVLSKS